MKNPSIQYPVGFKLAPASTWVMSLPQFHCHCPLSLSLSLCFSISISLSLSLLLFVSLCLYLPLYPPVIPPPGGRHVSRIYFTLWLSCTGLEKRASPGFPFYMTKGGEVSRGGITRWKGGEVSRQVGQDEKGVVIYLYVNIWIRLLNIQRINKNNAT